MRQPSLNVLELENLEHSVQLQIDKLIKNEESIFLSPSTSGDVIANDFL